MNGTTVLIIALVCVTLGYIGGALMSYLTRPKGAKEEDLLEKRVSTAQVEDPERAVRLVAAFYRDAPGAALQVEVGSKILRSASELKYEQREHLEKLVLELKSWLGYGPVAATPQPASEEAPAAPPPSREPYVQPAEPAAAPPAAPAASTAPNGTKEKANNKTSQSAPPSIVDQVDEILQEKIAGTPLAARGIRLSEIPQQGVVVWVGLERYEGIDNVPDPEVKALIREAVKEWEARYR
jgi:hypothetical protein